MFVMFMKPRVLPSIVGLLLLCAPGPARAQGRASTALTPQAALDELLAVDRECAATSATQGLVVGLSRMLADDVVMPIPGKLFAEGKAAAIEALRGGAGEAQVEWTPVGGGLSADGQHGFTLGFVTIRPPDGVRVPLKYLAYWVRRSEGWRVVAYKRARRPEGAVSLELMPAALPTRLVPPASDPAVVAGFTSSLDEAERAFSAEAQRIGLGPAFVKYGTADAVNMGGANNPGFVIGAENIARTVSVGQPATGSTLSWAPDRVIAASSGDLGVTIGVIHPNAPPQDGSQGFPFFTIWRRASPNAPWRYIAE